MNQISNYSVIGVMSGTSLDGLDLVQCTFNKSKHWQFEIQKCATIRYSKKWKSTLENLPFKNQQTINETNKDFGKFIGKEINKFKDKNTTVDFIASHGHTIFHQPEKKITLQIGDGKTIAQETKTCTITNFRNLDVSLNGQGAPLVPIGDLQLFEEYKFCLNLGGFANISSKEKNGIIAFDVCPVNIILNYLASKKDLEYDFDGELGKKGEINFELLQKLNSLKYYQKKYPKSLSREWLKENILSIKEVSILKTEDLLATFYEHIGFQIGKLLTEESVLVTGGGSFNSFLIEKISKYSKVKISLGDTQIINFKEALIFGFLGVLKIRSEVNCLSQVTGAIRDCSAGEIHEYLPAIN